MTLRAGFVAGIFFAALSFPASAHHTYAMFDRTHRVSMMGDVKEMDFENPHSWLRVMIRGEQDQAMLWSFEMGPPGVMRRQGWTMNTVHAGDHITVQFFPMKDGSYAGQLISVQLPDGKTIAGGPTGSSDEEETGGRRR